MKQMEASLDWVSVGMGGRRTQPKAPSRVSSATLAPALAWSCCVVTSASWICSLWFTSFSGFACMRGKRWMTDRRVNIISVYWSDPSANIDSFPSKTAGIMQFPSSVRQAMCRKDSCLTSSFSQERELKPGAIRAVKKHRRFLLRMPAFCFSLWTAFVIGETKILELRKHSGTQQCFSLGTEVSILPGK